MLWITLASLSLAAPRDLDDRVGRNELRVWSEATPLEGEPDAIAARLDHVGYRRVKVPDEPGEYAVGDVVTVYRREWAGHAAALVTSGEPGAVVEPVVLSESVSERRMPRIDVDFEELPPHVWQPLLALEDARFFDHVGLDAVGLARATVANVKAGRVVQGGSTITQQLVKNRDLTPERSMERKAAEAALALALEQQWSKEAILEAYLDHAYYGHVDGIGIYGIGAASRVYFRKEAKDLTLAEAATLAAVVQGPNALNPLRHPEAAKARRDRALDRMAELGWGDADAIAQAKRSRLRTRKTAPTPPPAEGFVRWVDPPATGELSTTLDPYLQHHATAALGGRAGALVAIDAHSGAVLAFAGDPTVARQPGSTVKPFVLLEAFDGCGLGPASRVEDGPVEVEGWEPRNHDRRWHGEVDLRTATMHSWNSPFVRVTEHCGRDAVAARMAAAGLGVDEVPSLPLGTVETTPLALAGAYAALNEGVALEPSGVGKGRRSRVSDRAAAYLARDVLTDVVQGGTGRRARVDGAWGKTGTTHRDGWFAGGAGSVVTVVWLEGTSSSQAASVWKDFMEDAAPARAAYAPSQPWTVMEGTIDRGTGQRVRARREGAEEELWRIGQAPPRRGILGRKPEVLR